MAQKLAVPRWPDNATRDRAWTFVQQWWHEQGYATAEGHHPGPGEARKLAAENAGDWDVLVFADADTIAHPEAVELAAHRALTEDRMVIAADSHMYLSRESSERIMNGGPWFCRPTTLTRDHCYAKPCSGVFAVPRTLWDRIGGYPGLGAHGQEDQVWFELCRIFDGTPTWTAGHITMHFWHTPAARDETHPEARRNYQLWRSLAKLRGPTAQHQARDLMARHGHVIP